MNDSSFDPSIFLDAVTTEAFTKRPLLPIGDYVATVGEMKAQSGMQRKDPTKAWTALNVRLDVDLTTNPSARAIVGQDKVVLFDFIGLDTTPSGGLDQSAGRNSKLRTYREALAMNAPGQPFAPRMMQGRQLLVKIKYGINPNSQEQQEEIAGVAAFKG